MKLWRVTAAIWLWSGAASAQEQPFSPAPPAPRDSSAAMIETPPSPEKQRLIADYLCLTGTQAHIDSGRDLERFALQDLIEILAANGGQDGSNPPTAFAQLSDLVLQIYKGAYTKHKDAFQRAYADHLNWEFTGAELKEITAFLRTDTGQHYLAGDWRMNAYTGTNTEPLIASIAAEAKAEIKAKLLEQDLKSTPALSLTEADLRAAMGVPDD